MFCQAFQVAKDHGIALHLPKHKHANNRLDQDSRVGGCQVPPDEHLWVCHSHYPGNSRSQSNKEQEEPAPDNALNQPAYVLPQAQRITSHRINIPMHMSICVFTPTKKSTKRQSILRRVLL